MRSRTRKTHEYRLVPTKWYEELPPDQKEDIDQQEVMGLISAQASLNPSFEAGIGRVSEFMSYFPGNNKVAEDGSWIMVKTPPHCEFTVTPMSFWYATPWPMDGYQGRPVHRVRIITPRGELGIFPHEYSKVDDMGKYFEFIGTDMELKFFGGVQGVPPDALFYLRSRGIGKREAITLLLGQIRSQEVCWLETKKEVAMCFTDFWPTDERNATMVLKKAAA